MIYSVGDEIRINCKEGWGGRFHKCKGKIVSEESPNKWRVDICADEVPLNMDVWHWQGTHSLLCNPYNMLKVV